MLARQRLCPGPLLFLASAACHGKIGEPGDATRPTTAMHPICCPAKGRRTNLPSGVSRPGMAQLHSFKRPQNRMLHKGARRPLALRERRYSHSSNQTPPARACVPERPIRMLRAPCWVVLGFSSAEAPGRLGGPRRPKASIPIRACVPERPIRMFRAPKFGIVPFTT